MHTHALRRQKQFQETRHVSMCLAVLKYFASSKHMKPLWAGEVPFLSQALYRHMSGS